MSKNYPLIPIENAIKHYGRPSDGRGGHAELARKCKVTSQAIYRWAGPYIPEAHVKKLVRKDHTLLTLAVNNK